MRKMFVSLMLLAVSLWLIISGVQHRQHIDVQRKAEFICIECIGLQ